MGVLCISTAIKSLGEVDRTEIGRPATDTDDVRKKLSHFTNLANKLGIVAGMRPLCHVAMVAIRLDDYFETGERSYLEEADREWGDALARLPIGIAREIANMGAAAIGYFYHEKEVRRRIERKDYFLYEEVVEHLLRRGGDAAMYARIASLDGLDSAITVAGFRARQALRDMLNDLRDLEHDRRSVGANLLMLTVAGRRRWLRQIADGLFRGLQRLSWTPTLQPLREHAEQTYEELRVLLK